MPTPEPAKTGIIYDGTVGDLLDGPGAFQDGINAGLEQAARIAERMQSADIAHAIREEINDDEQS